MGGSSLDLQAAAAAAAAYCHHTGASEVQTAPSANVERATCTPALSDLYPDRHSVLVLGMPGRMDPGAVPDPHYLLHLGQEMMNTSDSPVV